MKWISVDDQLPAENIKGLLLRDTSGICKIGEYDIQSGFYTGVPNDYEIDDFDQNAVAYWCEIEQLTKDIM